MRFRQLLLVGLLLGFTNFTYAQSFANEWINVQQSYYKITLNEDGIYRISYSELQSAGFPVNDINPKHLQLWFRGEERAIFVEGENDDSFDNGDFIEFYGQKNDGWLDRFMYENVGDQTNPYKNLYSDETAYFLTTTLDATEGKRIATFFESDITSTPAESHTEKTIVHFDNRFTQGRLYPTHFRFNQEGAHLSNFETGKGFTGVRYGNGNNNPTFTVPVSNFQTTSGDAPRLFMRLTGLSNGPHGATIEVSPDGTNFREVATTTFDDYANSDVNAVLTSSDLPSDGNLTIRVNIQDLNSAIPGEMLSVSYFILSYAQSIDAESQANKLFNIASSSGDKSRVLIANPPAGGRLFDISNPNNMILINHEDISGGLNAVVPDTDKEKNLLLTSEIKEVTAISSVSFESFSPNDISYLIVYHESLSQPSDELSNPVQAYADYRASAEGGNFEVALAEIHQLYDQFAYGEPHPLAIRNMIDFLITSGSGKLEHLFLLGNGLERQYEYERNKPTSLSWEFQNLVPCYGDPCSDNAFSANLNNANRYVHELSTGRLAARNPQHVEDYLRKVQEHESFEFDSFQRKDLLFLSGGQDENQRARMITYTEGFESIAQNEFLGAATTRFSKNTTFAVELFDVAEIVNQGIGMICFFGHSAPGITDIDIGFASDPLLGYNNQGKYPMIIVNGCNAGAMFNNSSVTLGEDWTLTPDKGAILFTAHSQIGFEFTMRNYSNYFLENIYGDSLMIGEPIGKGIIQAHQRFQDRYSSDGVANSNVQQFILQGDPAVGVFGTPKAEYAITDESLFIETANPTEPIITAASDSFKIGIALSNYGAVNPDDVEILVRRTFNTGEERIYPSQTFAPVFYHDTLFFVVRNSESDKSKALGRNIFEVIIDPSDSIPEVNENTNTGFIEYFFASNAVKIIQPTEFSIVNQQPVTLLAQNINNLSVDREYTFQLDTSDQFNSPALQKTNIISDFTPSWSVNLLTDNNTDSIVYYWRVRFTNPTAEDSPDWADASFLYIKDGPEGWSQSHFPQFKKNTKLNLVDNQTTRVWELQKDTITIDARVLGKDATNPNDSYLIKDDLFVLKDASTECGGGHILAMAIDSETGEVYNRTQVAFGFQDTYVCGSGTDFPVTRIPPSFLYGLGGFFFYLGTVDPDDYIVLMGVGDVQYESLNPGNYDQFATRLNIPESAFGSIIKSGEPFAAFTKLDDPSFTPIILGPDRSSAIPTTEQTLDVHFEFIPSGQAQIVSTFIGPAKEWKNAINVFSGKDTPADSVKLDFYGVKADGVNETLFFSDLQNSNNLDISSLDASEYPFARFKATIIDDDLNTATQLDKWQVYYTPLPEGILFPGITSSDKTIEERNEGEEISFSFGFKNVSDQNFSDSLIISYTIKKEDNSTIEFFDTLQVLNSSDSVAVTKTIDTQGLSGTNALTIFANPFLQAERDYANNFVQCQFKVLPDTIHPTLEVVIDGRHIMDGEIVSANPMIVIIGKDENEFLGLNDTSLLEIYISEPNSDNMVRISLNDPNLVWTSQGTGSFQVEYQPQQLADGIYKLRVQLKDASENLSGLEPFETRFEVINKSTITHFYPYPNPFSTSVRFVFTLTGQEIPDEIKIQIMTVSGRVVREITQDELGSIHIGNNITEFAWDGTDEYGDQLANGIYLYRVITRYNGQSIERRQTAKDNLFKKGIGKMYLMR